MEKKTLVGPEPSQSISLEDVSSISSELETILEFFRNSTCYDFLPKSSEVVVVDIDLPLQHAFSVAQDNGVTFATLWDSQAKKFCGMLTITDYVKMLLLFRDDPEGMNQSWNQPIRTWYNQSSKAKHGDLVACDVEDSLLEALRLLHTNHIHRLPTLHDGNLLHVICRPAVLGYVAAHYPLDSKLFSYSIESLSIGTFGQIFSCTPNTPLYTLLDICMSKKIAALPIADENGILVDLFSRYDVMHIAAEAEHNLESTVAEINSTCLNTEVYVCSKQDSLGSVLQHLMQTGSQRLICVNEHNKIEGLVTIGDIFKFFINHACSK